MKTINKVKKNKKNNLGFLVMIAVLMSFAMLTTNYSVFAKGESESGSVNSGNSGSSSSDSGNSGGNSGNSGNSGSNTSSDAGNSMDDNLPQHSGIDSAKDVQETGASAQSKTNLSVPITDDNLPKKSGIDSAKDVAEIKMFNNNLAFGMKNEQVIELQNILRDQGLFKEESTGFFGAITQGAVKQFQKSHNLPETGFVGPMTRSELNVNIKSKDQNIFKMSIAEIEKEIQNLTEKISQLQNELQKKILDDAEKAGLTPDVQAKAGIIITGGVSGPGYPTGPLNLLVPSTQLFLDRIGQVKIDEVKDRQYEAPLETIPPTTAALPVTINGVVNTANEIKIISNLKTKNGIGQHQGTVDVDIDTIPAGHVTLAYNGTATVIGSTIASKGTFKTVKTTGIFAGLIAEGTYEMTIIESGSVFGSPVAVSIATVTP